MGLDVIKIYADGACRGNQYKENIGAIGIVLLYKDSKKEIKKAFQDTTNNRMEILSVIEAFKLIKRYDISIEVYSDSQYVVDSINNNWAKNKNKDLWEALYVELYKFKAGVKFIKVKGHADNQYNNRADELANEAMDSFKRS